MKNKKWKAFHKMVEKCYENMIGVEKDSSCWAKGFELLKEVILEERQTNPNFTRELEMVDDETDYAYDIQGWLEDCLDEIDMREDYKTLLKMCNDLLELFSWPEYTGSDIRFRKSIVLRQLGQTSESVDFCRKWIEKEPENIVAATATVYALISIKEFAEAEKLVDQFIIDKADCSDENDMMFIAASKLYEAEGKKKEKRQVDRALEEYDKSLEEYFLNPDFDEDDFDFWDEDDLPFN